MLHHIERPQQQYPLRERPPVPVTLDSLQDLMLDMRSEVRDRIDGLSRDVMQRLDRQDDVIRYMLQQQGFAVPDYFQPPQQPHQDDPDDQ